MTVALPFLRGCDLRLLWKELADFVSFSLENDEEGPAVVLFLDLLKLLSIAL
jgi:hypothetical protein